MLRQPPFSHAASAVIPIDNGASAWRTNWVDDTIAADAVKHLQKRDHADGVLLLVYPVVSGEFTQRVIEAYRGDTVCVVGTQNGNGYTGFRDLCVDEWMTRDGRKWELRARVPVPSFAGKDDALFVFKRVIDA